MLAKRFELQTRIPDAGYRIATGAELQVRAQPSPTWAEPTRVGQSSRPLNLPDGVPESGTVPALLLIENNKAGTLPGWKQAMPFRPVGTEFLEFAKLSADKASDVLKLADRYGVLSRFDTYPTEGGGKVKGETLAHWLRQAVGMRVAVEVWRHLTRRDFDALGVLFRWTRTKPASPAHGLSGEGWQFTPPPEVGKPRWVTGERGEEVGTVAKRWLLDNTNAHIAGPVTPRVVSGDNGKPEVGLAPQTLLAALWLQFAFAVSGEQEYRECVNCGKPFAFDRGNKVSARRLYCGGSCRVLASRQRSDEKASRRKPKKDKNTHTKRKGK